MGVRGMGNVTAAALEVPYKTVTFDYAADDYAAAFRQIFLATRSERILGAIVLTTVIIGGFLLLYLKAGVSLSVALSLTAGGLLGGIVLAVMGWMFWGYYGRRYFAKSPLANVTTSLSLLPEGLRVTSSRGETTLLWSDFVGWRFDSKSTLLFTAPRVFLVIPARLADLNFPMADLHAALAREMGPPGGGGAWGIHRSKSRSAA